MARTLRLICIGLMMGVMAIGPGCHLIHSWQRSQWDEDCFMFQYALPGKAESEAQEFVLAKLGDVVVSMRFFEMQRRGDESSAPWPLQEELPELLSSIPVDQKQKGEMIKELYIRERKEPGKCVWLWLYLDESSRWRILCAHGAYTDSIY